MQLKAFLNKNKSIISFLILEVLALVSFTFANINDVFYLITTLLSICAFIFAFFTNSNKKDFYKLLPIVGGLFVISAIAAFGPFSKSFSLLSNIATFFAIPSFFSLGFFARRIEGLKAEHVVLAIGFGLAAITLIGTIITLVQYGPFYKMIHKAKPIYFYEGVAYNATKEMGWLMGFRITEVSVEYGGMFAILCAAFLPALLFIKVRENKSMFISSAVIGGIGLISLAIVPNWKALIFLAIASIFAFVYKFLKEKKIVTKVLFIGLISVVGLGVLFYLLTIVNAAAGFKLTGFLNRLACDNFIMRPATNTLAGEFSKDLDGSLFNLFGFDIKSTGGIINILNVVVEEPTLIFEYEIIKEVGLIGTILVLGFLATMFVFEVRYVKESNDSDSLKNINIVFLIAFMLYATFGFNIQSQPHDLMIYQAFLRSVPFMIVLFLLGFTYFVPKEEAKSEQPNFVQEANL